MIEQIIAADTAAVEKYNLKAKPEHHLQVTLGPCPYEGNIHTSPIVLLLANPGYDKNSSENDHHFQADGWPLSGLHEDAPAGMRNWWQPRLRQLCNIHGAKKVASNIAALQINPWASNKYHDTVRLPSQLLMMELAEAAARRGAVIVLMRASKKWLTSPIISGHADLFRTKSPRCSYISEGNLPDHAWKSINDQIAASKFC